jgi:hypothetical protein
MRPDFKLSRNLRNLSKVLLQKKLKGWRMPSGSLSIQPFEPPAFAAGAGN